MDHIFAEHPLRKTMIGMVAAGLVTSAALASAQGNQSTTDNGQQANQQLQSRQTRDVNWDTRFQDVDTDNNNGADWAELQSAYSEPLNAVGWQERQVLDRFDANKDGVLDENEYLFFLASLERNASQSQSGNQRP